MAEASRNATPTSVTEEPWIWEHRMENAMRNDYPEEESGKWMMFYPNNRIDEAWALAVDIYRAGYLPDIQQMKVSTAMPSDRGYPGQHVLIFYCGPASDERKMRAIGQDLVDKMEYNARTISYKTDQQTLRGERGSIYTIRLM